MKAGVIALMGGLMVLAGCQSGGNKAASAPAEPKWKGLPYRLTLDTAAAKSGKTGIDIPAVMYTANPEALESRADLVLRFKPSGSTDEAAEHLMIGTATDVHGNEGKLPEDYMEEARKGLANYFVTYCLKGKVDVSVALAQSSLDPHGDIAQVDAKRLSDWLPTQITFKNPHPKCK